MITFVNSKRDIEFARVIVRALVNDRCWYSQRNRNVRCELKHVLNLCIQEHHEVTKIVIILSILYLHRVVKF